MPAVYCNHYHHLRGYSKLAICIYGTILLLTRKRVDPDAIDPSPPRPYVQPIWRLVELLDDHGAELSKLPRNVRNNKASQYHVALNDLVAGGWLTKIDGRKGGPKHYFARTHKEWVALRGTGWCLMARDLVFPTDPDL